MPPISLPKKAKLSQLVADAINKGVNVKNVDLPEIITYMNSVIPEHKFKIELNHIPTYTKISAN